MGARRFLTGTFVSGALASGVLLSGAATPAAAQNYQLCVKLEARLVQLDRQRPGRSAPTRNNYAKVLDQAYRKLSTARQQAQRAGCSQQQGFLFFRAPRPPHCQQHDRTIKQIEANIRTIRSRGRAAAPANTATINRERRNILTMLGENGCGPQYARYARVRQNNGLAGLFLRDYTRDPFMERRSGHSDFHGTYRTICVRQCDGFFWPISFSTVQSHFARDEQMCRASCPNQTVNLYVHKMPGEATDSAVSLGGQPYSAAPNAFRYRDEFVDACSCRTNVQTAALAERVVVTLAARDGTLPQGGDTASNRRDRWAGLGIDRSGAANRDAFAEPIRQAIAGSTPIAGSAPVPRPRPGNEIPVTGSIATLTGLEDFEAITAPQTVAGSDGLGGGRSGGDKSVRVVGPGFTLYRSAGE